MRQYFVDACGKNRLVLLFLIQLFSLILAFWLQSMPDLTLFRAILYMFSLIFCPGYYLMLIFSPCFDAIEKIGFTLIFGLTYQLFVIFFMFFISIFVVQFNFVFLISLTSVIPICFLLVTKRQKARRFNLKQIYLNRNVVIFCLLLLVGLVIRVLYQNFSINPHTDTALVAEMARNLFINGEFTSKIIHSTMPMYFQLGFSSHLFANFVYALFFVIGGISYPVIKFATIFFGILVFFPVYSITKRILNEKVAFVAVGLVAVHPVIIFFSSIPINGSEIMATLYLFSAICFIYFVLSSKGVKYALIGGVFTFGTFAMRIDYCYVLLLILPFLFILVSKKMPKLTDLAKISLLAYPIILLTRFFHFYLIILLITVLYSSFFIWWIFVHKKIVNISVSNITLLCVVVFGLYSLYLMRFHSFPQLLEYSTADVLTNPTEKALFGFGALDLSTFTSRLTEIWQITSVKLSPPILFLSVISLACLAKLKKVLFFIAFPITYSVIFALLNASIGGADHHRFHLASYFFLIILAAFSIFKIFQSFSSHLHLPTLSSTKITLKPKSLFKKIFLNKIFTGFILFVVMFSFFFSLYASELNVIEVTDVKSLFNYEPAINWVLNNTSSDDVLMTRKPYEFAWYTDRFCTLPGQSDLTLDELCKTIQSFKVNYLIVDKLFLYTYNDEEILSLYTDPWEQSNFVPVFISSSTPNIVIYNVTILWDKHPISEVGPDITVETNDTIFTISSSIEYFNPQNATCVFELSNYSQYSFSVPSSLFFESISPMPLSIQLSDERIYFEADPTTTYELTFKTNLLIKIGWRATLFLNNWIVSPLETVFETDKPLLMGYNNSSPVTVWATATKEIDEPVNVTSFPNLLFKYRFIQWTPNCSDDVYFTVRIYGDGGNLEETALIHPMVAGEWQMFQVSIKSLKNVEKIVLVVRTGSETSLLTELDYVCISDTNYFLGGK